MTTVKNFKDLNVWRMSRELVTDIYRLCAKFPSNEKYGLASQMQRAAVSIPSNIAEGFDRKSNKEFEQFLSIARGSVAELNTQLIIANDLGLIDDNDFKSIEKRTIEVHKMINSFLKYLRKDEKK